MSTSLFKVCAKFDQRQASPIKMSGVLVAAAMGKSPLIALQRSIKWEIVFFSESAPMIIYFLYTFFRELLLQHRKRIDGLSCWQSLKTFPKRPIFFISRNAKSSKSNLQNTCALTLSSKRRLKIVTWGENSLVIASSCTVNSALNCFPPPFCRILNMTTNLW